MPSTDDLYEVLQGPAHGMLIRDVANEFAYWRYKTNPGFAGKDRAVFSVEVGRKKFSVTVNYAVQPILPEDGIPDGCRDTTRRLGGRVPPA